MKSCPRCGGREMALDPIGGYHCQRDGCHGCLTPLQACEHEHIHREEVSVGFYGSVFRTECVICKKVLA